MSGSNRQIIWEDVVFDAVELFWVCDMQTVLYYTKMWYLDQHSLK